MINPLGKDFGIQAVWNISSLTDLKRFANRLATICFPGLFLGLKGELGSGKTTFTKMLLEELECPNPEFVTSPTFVFMQEYPASIPVSHFDLYRLKDSMEFESMGGMELFAPETISIVEWPERLNGLLPVNRIELYFETKNSNARKITITGHGLASNIVETKLMP